MVRKCPKCKTKVQGNRCVIDGTYFDDFNLNNSTMKNNNDDQQSRNLINIVIKTEPITYNDSNCSNNHTIDFNQSRNLIEEPCINQNNSNQENHPIENSNIKKLIYCKICPFKTYKFCNLSFHLTQHKYKHGFLKCKYCPYYARKEKDLKGHEILHKKYKYLKKKSRNQTNTQTSEINNIENNCNQTQEINNVENNCNICPYKARQSVHLKRHLTYHKYQPGYFKCRYCDYYIEKTTHLDRHERLHANYEPSETNTTHANHFCNICPYKTSLSANLKRHLTYHNYKERYFKCRYCDFYIEKPTHLDHHERLHPNYVAQEDVSKSCCNICPYKTRYFHHLKRHLAYHQYQKEYLKCQFCDYYTEKVVNLNRHEKLHRNAKQIEDTSI